MKSIKEFFFRNDYFLLAAIIILAFYIDLHWLFRGYIYDELVTLKYYVDVPSFYHTVSNAEYFNHIFYCILARCCFLLFGSSEWVLRTPALLLALLSILFIWFFCKKYYGRAIAILAALSLAVSPIFTIFSVTARGYTGQVLFALISTHYFFLFKDPAKPHQYVLYILANAMGLYIHLYFIFVPFIQALLVVGTFLFEVSRGKNWRMVLVQYGKILLAILLSLLLTFFLYLPILMKWTAAISQNLAAEFQESFPFQVLFEFSGRMPLYLSSGLVLLALIGLHHLYLYQRYHFYYYLSLLTLPFPIIMLSRPYFLFPRFVIFLLPFFLILIVIGAVAVYKVSYGHLFSRWVKVVRFAMILVGIGLIIYWISVSWRICLTDNFQAVGNYVKSQKYPANDIYCAIGLGAEFFEFYCDRKVLIPTSLADFENIAAHSDSVRCFYRFRTQVISDEHREIRDFLEQHARKQKVGSAYIYSYGKKKW